MKAVEQNNPTKKVDDKFRRCTQIQCGYYLQGGCKFCENCKSESYILDTTCSRCLRCEGVANELRWGDRNIDNKEDVKIPRKRMIIMANGVPIGMVEEIEPQQRKPREEKEMVM